MGSAGKVESSVGDPKLVEARQRQIVDAAVKLFSDKGFYRTTILDIANEAGTSSGLIYKYFKDKDDVLYLSLLLVLETYEREIPPRLEGIEHPVERLTEILRAYCLIIDDLRDATILAYRSTKSLPPKRRKYIKQAEERTNRLVRSCLEACIEGGFLKPVNLDLLVYQFVTFCHNWALKHWAFREKYSVEEYVSEGAQLLIVPHLTPAGLEAFKRNKR